MSLLGSLTRAAIVAWLYVLLGVFNFLHDLLVSLLVCKEVSYVGTPVYFLNQLVQFTIQCVGLEIYDTLSLPGSC